MSNIKLTLPDGSVLELPRGTTGLEAARRIGSRLAKAAVAVQVNGAVRDLGRPIEEDAAFAVLTPDQPEGIEVMRHSCSHVMAQAVQELFPEAKLAIGPAIEDGFYYDLDVPQPFSSDDLERIEARMAEIIRADHAFGRREVSREEAEQLFAARGERFKLELIRELPADQQPSLYTHDDWTDLCAGPHLPSTGRIGAFKLMSVAGAYWRGDAAQPMLQRIYGTCFADAKQLAEYLHRLEEAKRRDHRVLGRDLELFSFYPEAGAGLVYYHPNGAMLRHIVEQFSIREHLKRGYQLLSTPHLVKSDIWETSGHKQQGYPMYFLEIEGQEYGVKPMNCPGHILIYKSKTRSYRDLPLRFFELGTVYRHEPSGTLQGLLRVRGFTQDDAHIFCRPDQLTEEIVGVVRFARHMLRSFGFEEYKVFLSTRPEKSLGDAETWERATGALRTALEQEGQPYEVDPGEGVFYGPKIDVKLRDAIGRYWQGPTIQCDFNLAERFELSYIGEDGKEHRPVMVHRVVLAGIERFLGALIENCAGDFPLWLAPQQAIVLPITERHHPYAAAVREQLQASGGRVTLDDRSETLGHRIREAELQKIPYMLVVGDREEEATAVSVRSREKGDEGSVGLAEFAARLANESRWPE